MCEWHTNAISPKDAGNLALHFEYHIAPIGNHSQSKVKLDFDTNGIPKFNNR
jgi:hypothetical protein